MTIPHSCNELIKTSPVKFGTSGARGLIEDFSPELCAAFTTAFIRNLQVKYQFTKLFIGIDNRPSSPLIAKYCGASAAACGVDVEFFGVLPTPALAYYALQNTSPSVVITGSHIPFDRNGLKFYTPNGEISKQDELAIVNSTESVMLDSEFELPKADDSAVQAYVSRNTSIFEGKKLLKGKKIGVYEHSSAGRDIYRDVFQHLGAEVVSLGRSEEFVPIDTEAVSEEDKAKALTWSQEHFLDAIFSTDGDGDRPLIADENGVWLNGDIVGILASAELGIDAISTPVSCNTAIEKSELFKIVRRTKIGSPYVIAEFDSLNKDYQSVAGFEANGGFILGTDCNYHGEKVSALPTRDALLPFLLILAASIRRQEPVSEQLENLPARVTRSNRLKDIATDKSKAMIEQAASDVAGFLDSIHLPDTVSSVSVIDGLRITLSNEDVVHLRPSGNAPELRVYIETNSADASELLLAHVLTKVSEKVA